MRAPRPRIRRRRGSTYVLVLSTAMLLTVVGLSGVAVVRIQARITDGANEAREAEILATAAIEHALAILEEHTTGGTPTWRTSGDFVSGTPTPKLNLGRGEYRWMLVDEGDDNLANNFTDPIRLYGIGFVGDAVRSCSVLLQSVNGLGYNVLQNVLHTNANLSVGGMLVARGGPVSTNANLSNAGTIDGDVAAASGGSGTVTGTATIPAPYQPMPSPSLFEDLYLPRATEIPWESMDGGSGWMEAPLLAAGVNPWGEGNAEGIYHITVPSGWHLRCRVSRIKATLLVTMTSDWCKLKLDAPTVWNAHRPDLPIFLVRGMGTVELKTNGTLDETVIGANLNPAEAPYKGESDNDLADTYTAQLRGLIHVTSPSVEIDLLDGYGHRGTLITQGPVSQSGLQTLTADLNLYYNPPQGYNLGSVYMRPVNGSWKRAALPP